MRILFFLLLCLALTPSLALAQNQSPDQFEVTIPEAKANDPLALFPWLQLSGEVRERATFISDIEFDPDNEFNGWFWTQRLSLTGDIEATPWLRGRVTVQSALQEGGDISPVERNVFDLQEGWVEIGNEDAFLRLGRQEFQLGSARLLSARNGTNVKRTWDGGRGFVRLDDWTVDAFGLVEVEVEQTGVFNDFGDYDNTLAGAYVTGPAPLGKVDLYYLYSAFDDRTTIENTANQQRHSVGIRSFGEYGPIFWNWEAIYQFGQQGDIDISAWTVAANTGYRFNDLPWSPEFLLSTNVSSGDDEQGDGTLGTFDALFPRGSYFSELALLGPSNFYNIHPYLKAHPRDDVLIWVDVNFYWRFDPDDAIYGPPGNIIRVPGGSDEPFVNTSFSAGIEWEATENIFLSLLYTHSAPGAFIEATGPDASINFLEFTLSYSF